MAALMPESPDSAKKQEFLSLLPANYSYFLNTINISKESEDDYVVNFRIKNIGTEEGAREWLASFQETSKMTFRCDRTYPNSGRKNVWKADFRCHHNTRNQKTVGKRKNTECRSTLTLIVKRVLENTRSCDPYLRDWPMIVTIKMRHNHPLDAPPILKYRSVSKEIEKKFLELYRNGHTPISALKAHKVDLMLEHGDNYATIAGDRNICPDASYCYRLFYKKIRKKVEITDRPRAEKNTAKTLEAPKKRKKVSKGKKKKFKSKHGPASEVTISIQHNQEHEINQSARPSIVQKDDLPPLLVQSFSVANMIELQAAVEALEGTTFGDIQNVSETVPVSLSSSQGTPKDKSELLVVGSAVEEPQHLESQDELVDSSQVCSSLRPSEPLQEQFQNRTNNSDQTSLPDTVVSAANADNSTMDVNTSKNTVSDCPNVQQEPPLSRLQISNSMPMNYDVLRGLLHSKLAALPPLQESGPEFPQDLSQPFLSRPQFPESKDASLISTSKEVPTVSNTPTQVSPQFHHQQPTSPNLFYVNPPLKENHTHVDQQVPFISLQYVPASITHPNQTLPISLSCPDTVTSMTPPQIVTSPVLNHENQSSICNRLQCDIQAPPTSMESKGALHSDDRAPHASMETSQVLHNDSQAPQAFEETGQVLLSDKEAPQTSMELKGAIHNDDQAPHASMETSQVLHSDNQAPQAFEETGRVLHSDKEAPQTSMESRGALHSDDQATHASMETRQVLHSDNQAPHTSMVTGQGLHSDIQTPCASKETHQVLYSNNQAPHTSMETHQVLHSDIQAPFISMKTYQVLYGNNQVPHAVLEMNQMHRSDNQAAQYLVETEQALHGDNQTTQFYFEKDQSLPTDTQYRQTSVETDELERLKDQPRELGVPVQDVARVNQTYAVEMPSEVVHPEVLDQDEKEKHAAVESMDLEVWVDDFFHTLKDKFETNNLYKAAFERLRRNVEQNAVTDLALCSALSNFAKRPLKTEKPKASFIYPEEVNGRRSQRRQFNKSRLHCSPMRRQNNSRTEGDRFGRWKRSFKKRCRENTCSPQLHADGAPGLLEILDAFDTVESEEQRKREKEGAEALLQMESRARLKLTMASPQKNVVEIVEPVQADNSGITHDSDVRIVCDKVPNSSSLKTEVDVSEVGVEAVNLPSFSYHSLSAEKVPSPSNGVAPSAWNPSPQAVTPSIT